MKEEDLASFSSYFSLLEARWQFYLLVFTPFHPPNQTHPNTFLEPLVSWIVRFSIYHPCFFERELVRQLFKCGLLLSVTEQRLQTIAEHHAEYPRALYHRAFKRERDGAGKIVPSGEVFPLPTADAINPNYPIPANVAQRAGIKGILSTSEGSPAVIGQHLYRTCLAPAGWQVGDKIVVQERGRGIAQGRMGAESE